MIKNYIQILICVFAFTALIGCKDEERINVAELISTYNLESYGNYEDNKRLENKWFSKDSSLVFTLYENRKTDYFLHIVQNRINDTIFKYFDSTAYDLKIRAFFRTEDNYFVSLWDPSLKNYIGYQAGYNDNIGREIYKDLYTYDSLNIYLVDSTSHKLTEIEKPLITNIASIFKNTYKLNGDFNPIKNKSKIRLVKDTLKNHKVFYESDVGLEIEKNSREFVLKPYFFNKSKIEVDSNNFSLAMDNFLTSKSLNGEVGYYFFYDNNFDNRGYSKLDLVFRTADEEHVIQTSLDSLFIDEKFVLEHIDNRTALSIEAFKYVDGQFFLHIYQNKYAGGWLNPKIYHIDTNNWKISQVLPFNTNKDKTYKKLKKVNEPEILSAIYKSNLSNVLKNFEIVKVGSNYRLKQIM